MLLKLLVGIILMTAGAVCNIIAMYRQYGVIGLFINSEGLLGFWALLHQKIAWVGFILVLLGFFILMKGMKDLGDVLNNET